jgi:SAM-dependent methyltransferase
MLSITVAAGSYGSWRTRIAVLCRRIRNRVARMIGVLRIPPSKLALKYLHGLEGLEIGGSAHNPFGLKTKNVDFQAELDTIFKKFEIEMCGEALPVDIVAAGDDLPVSDESQDFVISSHVIEHFFDPIKALREWMRVVRPGGYIFIIAPHKERTFDRDRPRTTLAELIARHEGRIPRPSHDTHEHYSVWITEDLLELCHYLGFPVVEYQEVDDKVGNGFTIVIKKEGELCRQPIPAGAPGSGRRRAA